MRKILKLVSKNGVLYAIFPIWGLILLIILNADITKYISWNINFEKWYDNCPALVIVIFIILTIVLLGNIIIKVALKKTERFLIIQDGMYGKELPITELSKLYETQNFRTHLINFAKKDIEAEFTIMLSDFNNINNKNNNGKYIYYGVSYIPFVYKLGSLYGDQGIDVRFCQISRKNEKTELIKFKNHNKNPFTDINSVFIEKENKNDLLVTIGLSFEIDEKMDEKFQNMSRLTFTTSDPKRELLMCNSDIKYAVDYVVKEIRKYQNNYERVHLFISASTAFIFRLGMEYSKNSYDKLIIVYHYESKNRHNRPWGIEINSYKSSAVIINK